MDGGARRATVHGVAKESDMTAKQQQIITTETIDNYKGNGKEIQKRGDTCICIAESLCSIPETTTLLISYELVLSHVSRV